MTVVPVIESVGEAEAATVVVALRAPVDGTIFPPIEAVGVTRRWRDGWIGIPTGPAPMLPPTAWTSIGCFRLTCRVKLSIRLTVAPQKWQGYVPLIRERVTVVEELTRRPRRDDPELDALPFVGLITGLVLQLGLLAWFASVPDKLGFAVKLESVPQPSGEGA